MVIVRVMAGVVIVPNLPLVIQKRILKVARRMEA